MSVLALGLRDALADDLRRHAFRGRRRGAPRIGVEIELIPVVAATRRVAPIASGEPFSSLDLLRAVGVRAGWAEHLSSKGAPVFCTPEGGKLTFEPGGQIEFGSPPVSSGSELVHHLRQVGAALRERADEVGIELLALGIDPVNPVSDAPLQLHGSRYTRMAQHFAGIGPAGARMMRQTASMQVNLDMVGDEDGGWRLMNAVAPYLVALFANSRQYAGRDSGHASFRAHCWRVLDPSRTGLPYDESDAARAYADFALDASAILVGGPPEEAPTYREWVAEHGWDAETWTDHLTTLFPEVRPRGYLEIRSIDALPAESYSAPVAFLSGLLYDDVARRTASDLVGTPSARLLCHAGIVALRDPAIAAVAAQLVQLALEGCGRLGRSWLTDELRDEAEGYFTRVLG